MLDPVGKTKINMIHEVHGHKNTEEPNMCMRNSKANCEKCYNRTKENAIDNRKYIN